MADIGLTRKEQFRLSRFLKGRGIPPGMRRGTWSNLVTKVNLSVIEHDDLIALLNVAPDVLIVLGIPAMGINGKSKTD